MNRFGTTLPRQIVTRVRNVFNPPLQNAQNGYTFFDLEIKVLAQAAAHILASCTRNVGVKIANISAEKLCSASMEQNCHDAGAENKTDIHTPSFISLPSSTWLGAPTGSDISFLQSRPPVRRPSCLPPSAAKATRTAVVLSSATRGAERRDGMKRREFLTSMLMLTGIPGAAYGQVHSELSELASKLPGVGKSDIYYPDYLLGDWILNRVLYAVEAAPELEAGSTSSSGHAVLSPQGVDNLRKAVGMKRQYAVRFMEFRGHVVEDRRSSARVEIGLPSDEDAQRVDMTWSADNPNVLGVTWNKGTQVREVKVTKRSFSDDSQQQQQQQPGLFATSEYARVADLAGLGALVGRGAGPSVYGRRRMARYAVRFAEAGDGGAQLQAVGVDRFVLDLLYAPAARPDDKPLVTLRYRDFLRRK